MFFIISKIVSFLFKPFIWSFILFGFSLMVKKKKLKKNFRIVGITILLFFSNPFLFTQIASYWESGRDSYLDERYELGIVLGGYASKEKDDKINFHLSNGRLMHCIGFYQKGNLDKILLSGGSGDLWDQASKESNLVSDFLKSNNIIKNHLLTESQSRNTFENAKYSKEIIDSLKVQKILVFTSAFHAYRAKKCFNKVGLYPDFYTTSYLSKQSPKISILPSSETLFHWELLIKEWVGIVVYKLQGKI